MQPQQLEQVRLRDVKVRLKVTLERELADYLERDRITHKLKTRSDAIEEAIRNLRHAELERDTVSAASDPAQQADADWWAFTSADGLRG